MFACPHVSGFGAPAKGQYLQGFSDEGLGVPVLTMEGKPKVLGSFVEKGAIASATWFADELWGAARVRPGRFGFEFGKPGGFRISSLEVRVWVMD
jgi:hypothetical protein